MIHIASLNFNGFEDTKKLLLNLAEQNLKNISIHILDNGSTDSSLEDLFFLLNENKTLKKYVKLHRTEQNLGFSGGCNYLVKKISDKAGKADSVLLLNNDALVCQRTLEFAERFVREKQNFGLLGFSVIKGISDATIWFGGGIFNPALGVIRHVNENQPFQEKIVENKNSYEISISSYGYSKTTWVSGCAMLIRIETILEHKLFRTGFFAYAEDVDLSLRLSAIGLEHYILNRAFIIHGSSKTFGKSILMKSVAEYLLTRNLYITIKKYGRGALKYTDYYRRLIEQSLRILASTLIKMDIRQLKRFKGLAYGFLDGLRQKMGKPDIFADF